MANECTPFYTDADRVTASPSAAVTGCRLVGISGARVSAAGPTLNLIQIALATAGAKAFGVASRDAGVGVPVTVIRGPKEIVPIQATNATISAFAEVEAAGTGAGAGMVQTKNTGVAVGYAVTDCAANGLAQVSLY